jgi:hypothetical protein
LAYSRYNSLNRNLADSAFPRWSYQRPGNKEDEYTARYCADYLLPALVAAGHCVRPQRALDPVHGYLDKTEVALTPELLPQLQADQSAVVERWKLNAAIEAVLRGVARPEWARGMGWSHDPVIAAWAERQAPGDVYLSIHQNWYRTRKMFGPVVLYCRGSRRGKELAESIYQSILDAFSNDPWSAGAAAPWGSAERQEAVALGSRWMCRDSGLYELRRTAAPAVLVELGFESNKGDKARMADPAWCQRMADAITRGLT